MRIIPPKVRHLWSEEEIRILVLASLSLQVVLIFLSLFRQRRRNKLLSLFLWSAYLGADYVATLALGNLLSKQNDMMENSNTDTGDIIAFWSPFLLLHLGGPDTITAYSLEDNELWLRHFLGLILQVFTAIFIFLESLPSPHLWAVAIVVFAYGILKFGERTWSLRSASMDQLRDSMISEPDPGPNYVKFMQEYQSRLSAGLDAVIKVEKEPYHALPVVELRRMKDKEIILRAHNFFETFKRLTVDLMLSFQDRIVSQEFFLERFPRQAFQVVEVELSFLHDILHTKAYYVHSFKGRIMRALSLIMAAFALVLFHRSKHPFNPSDVIITYVLLVAALVLEFAAVVLLIFSDWTIVALQQSHKPFRRKFLGQIPTAKLSKYCAEILLKIRRTLVPGSQKWWSNSMRQYNLISLCLKDYNITETRRRLRWLLGKLLLRELWDIWKNVNHVDFSDDAKRLIFQELKEKAGSAEGNPTSFKRLKACRGEWVLREKGYNSADIGWSVKKEFDESILLWHIATFLCHQKEEEEKDKPSKLETKIMERIKKIFKIMEKIKKIFERIKSVGKRDQQRADDKENDEKTILKKIKKFFERIVSIGERDQQRADDKESDEKKIETEVQVLDHKKISKEISDYMMYLVVFQPAMLPAGIGKIRFQDTCAEAMKFFRDKNTEMLEVLLEKFEGGSSDHAVDVPNEKTTTNGVIMKIYKSIRRCFSWKKPPKPPTTVMDMEKLLKKDKKLFHEKEKVAWDKLLAVDATIEPIEVKGDRSKSVLWDACKLAKAIMKIKETKETKETNIWVIISAVWVEMLCYAASNCTAYAHAKQLSQGGELLTHVWLLMAHMGIGEQYRIEAGHARAKLLVTT